MPALMDSHCHLTFDELRQDIVAVLQRAREAGVVGCITIATDIADAARALALSHAHPDIHVAAGIHPHEAGRVEDGWDERLADIVAREDVFAVGEMGLDYHYDFSDRSEQADVFKRQLEIAAEVEKPVVIHCREAHADTLDILSSRLGKNDVVFHCFTGSKTEAAEILDRGYWISLTGVVTFKKSDELREVARMLPEERIMIETDSPYLSPVPVRNVRPNEPAHVIHTAACIAEARGMSLEHLAGVSLANTRRFFRLPGNDGRV